MNIAIIGAGITGLYLAWKLAEAGYRVTVFEKKEKVGGKVCSALISERLGNFVPLDDELIENKINYCQIHFPRKTITLGFRPCHLAVNREKLLENLAELCQKKGARILFTQNIQKAPENFDRVIAADGASSEIRKSLGIGSPPMRLGILFSMPEKNNSDTVETWPIKKGFCWKIPKQNQAEYGALGPAGSVKKDFEKFCEIQKIKFNDAELQAALVPSGFTASGSSSIALCGDAAGLTKPWSGGGVIWGLQAADLLLQNFPNFDRFHTEAKKTFKPRILKGRLAVSLAHLVGRNLPFIMPSKISIDNDFLKL